MESADKSQEATESNPKGKIIIGIDLGTTKSGVSVWDEKQGRVVMLPEPDKPEVTPSMVGRDHVNHTWVVGQAAKALATVDPTAVAYSIKRYIGRWYAADRAVLYGRQDLTYNLVPGDGTDPLRDVNVDFGAEDGEAIKLSAPEISAKILAKLREDAARGLDLPLEEVKYAVITVPAYFNFLQRRATILAGQLAGLTVVDILNEPTAAALAYGDYAPDLLGAEEKRLLVYDLGGGTFDVSLLEAKRDNVGYQFYACVVDGDTRLGGDDIDASVVRWLASEIESRYHCRVLPDDLVTRARLRQEAERAKIALSTQERVIIDLPALDLGSRDPFDARIELTRTHLDACASDVLERANAIVQRAIVEVAGLKWDDIDEIILVGGQTLMPAVQRSVEALTGKKPPVLQRPQLAVALGAGEYGRILSRGLEKFEENALINVIALPLGIRLDDNTFQKLILANATVPCLSEPLPITTTEDYQTKIVIEVLQGPRNAPTADECVSLGKLEMEVPPELKRIPKLNVVFDVKADGTMKLIVTDTRRNRSETLDIIETHVITLRDQPRERK